MTKLVYNNKFVVVTLLQVIPQEIVRYKTTEKDWYSAVVIGVHPKDVVTKKWVWMKKYSFQEEFATSAMWDVGQIIDSSLLEWVDTVSLVGTSKWKGFQWYIKRFHAAGMPATHGHKYTKHGWSIGNRKPRRTQKWHPNPGHMWSDRTTLQNIQVLDKITVGDEQLVVVKGSVPGGYNSYIKVVIK